MPSDGFPKVLVRRNLQGTLLCCYFCNQDFWNSFEQGLPSGVEAAVAAQQMPPSLRLVSPV